MSESTPTATDQHVLITRVFDAPRERVFRAWTDPEALAAWYGPDHVRVPHDRVEIDLRVGGRYQLTMLLPHGGEFTVGYEIIELVEPELLVLRSAAQPPSTAQPSPSRPAARATGAAEQTAQPEAGSAVEEKRCCT